MGDSQLIRVGIVYVLLMLFMMLIVLGYQGCLSEIHEGQMRGWEQEIRRHESRVTFWMAFEKLADPNLTEDNPVQKEAFIRDMRHLLLEDMDPTQERLALLQKVYWLCYPEPGSIAMKYLSWYRESGCQQDSCKQCLRPDGMNRFVSDFQEYQMLGVESIIKAQPPAEPIEKDAMAAVSGCFTEGRWLWCLIAVPFFVGLIGVWIRPGKPVFFGNLQPFKYTPVSSAVVVAITLPYFIVHSGFVIVAELGYLIVGNNESWTIIRLKRWRANWREQREERQNLNYNEIQQVKADLDYLLKQPDTPAVKAARFKARALIDKLKREGKPTPKTPPKQAVRDSKLKNINERLERLDTAVEEQKRL